MLSAKPWLASAKVSSRAWTLATAVAEPGANTAVLGAERSKLFAPAKVVLRLTVSACDRSPVRVSVNANAPPSVTGPAGGAMVTLGSAPPSLSMMMPFTVPKPA